MILALIIHTPRSTIPHSLIFSTNTTFPLCQSFHISQSYIRCNISLLRGINSHSNNSSHYSHHCKFDNLFHFLKMIFNVFMIQFIQVFRIYPFSGTGNRIASFNKKHYLCRVPPFFLGLQGTRHPLLSLTIYREVAGCPFQSGLQSHYIPSPCRNSFSILIKTIAGRYKFYLYSTKWAIYTPVPYATHRCDTFTCRQSLYILYHQLIYRTTASMGIVQTTAYGCYSQSHQ